MVRRYLTFMETVISSKGQIIIPAPLRVQDRIVSGQKFEIERVDAGQYLLKRQPEPDNAGLVDWLLACPAKGFYSPAERKETTDDLPTLMFK